MSMSACPYCYHRIDLALLRFQCTGRTAPGGQRCRPDVDEARMRLTGYSLPSLPTFSPPVTSRLGQRLRPPRQSECPGCRFPTGLRACPVCHTTLSAAFAEGPSPLIGMVGGKNAGKTVYMTVLTHELRGEIRRRFDAAVRLVGEQQAGEGSSKDWLDRYERALFTNKALPESTSSARDGLRTPLVLEWQARRRSLGREVDRSTVLSFYDAAGEDLTTQDIVNSQAYLAAADGLIVLLDPFQLAGVRDRVALTRLVQRDTELPLHVLSRITEMLRTSRGLGARRKVNVPIAVVFSKIDAFYRLLGDGHPLLRAPAAGPYYDEAVGQDTDEHVRALLRELDADDIDAHLRYNYKRFRYFAVSSLGAEPDYARLRVDPSGVRPYRVDEPLLWLLSLFSVIDRSRA